MACVYYWCDTYALLLGEPTTSERGRLCLYEMTEEKTHTVSFLMTDHFYVWHLAKPEFVNTEPSKSWMVLMAMFALAKSKASSTSISIGPKNPRA
jgi:hypothetical protein